MRWRGQRYVLPYRVSVLLTQVFGESTNDVVVIEYSAYAKLHGGMRATTRHNRILLSDSGANFVADPELMLHEYFHVLRQWNTGELTRGRYLAESLRRGYWRNRFEREARAFTAIVLPRYWQLEGVIQ